MLSVLLLLRWLHVSLAAKASTGIAFIDKAGVATSESLQ
jgi:hypothetical protein